MKTISIAQLRHDPGDMLDDVADGAIYEITRYRKPVARVTPLPGRRMVSGIEVMAALQAFPADPAWAAELRALRRDEDDSVRLPRADDE